MFMCNLFGLIKKKNTNKLFLHFLVILIFSVIYYYYLIPEDFNSSDTLKGYIDTLYHTIITHASVGYGDIYPKTRRARLITMCHVILVIALLI